MESQRYRSLAIDSAVDQFMANAQAEGLDIPKAEALAALAADWDEQSIDNSRDLVERYRRTVARRPQLPNTR